MYTLIKFLMVFMPIIISLEHKALAVNNDVGLLQKALGSDYKIYEAFREAAHCDSDQKENSSHEPLQITEIDLEKSLLQAGITFGQIKKQYYPDFIIEQVNRSGSIVRFGASQTKYWPYTWTFYLNDRAIIRAPSLCGEANLQAATYDEHGAPKKLSVVFSSQVVSIDLKPDLQPIEEVYGCVDYEDKNIEYLNAVANDIERIALAVIDDGFDYNDKMLAYKIDRSGGFDTFYNDAKPYFYEPKNRGNALFEPSSHGTGVAGVAARETDKIKLIPISYNENSEGSILSAVDRAKTSGARVVNLSFGGKFLESMCQKIEENPDILFVAGAGNENENLEEKPFYPAACESKNLISVGSVNEFGQKSDFSSFSKKYVHLAARGEKVLTAMGMNVLGEQTGTSFAAPQVANVAARILAINSHLSPSEVKEIILSTVIKREQLKEYFCSSGELDEQAALTKAHLTKN